MRPDGFLRAGLDLTYKSFSTNFQYSYTGKCFNDAYNTVLSSDGVTGLIPAYLGLE